MADATYLSVEAVADETTASAGNCQMTPTVTGGTVTIDSATFSTPTWPFESKTKSVRYDGTSANGGCFTSVTPGGASDGWERLTRLRAGDYPSGETSIFQQRPASGTNIDVKMSTTGQIKVYNAANTLIYTFAAVTFPGAYYIGYYVKPHASTGEITIRIWSATGVLIEQYTTTTANTGSSPSTSIRVGPKVNTSTITWTIWMGTIEQNHTGETALTLSPPITDPVPDSTVVNGWIHDDTTDATAGTLTISSVVLDPAILYIIDNTNHRIAVEASEVPVDYSYRVTNGTTGRYADETGTIPATTGGDPSPAQRMRMIDGDLVELL